MYKSIKCNSIFPKQVQITDESLNCRKNQFCRLRPIFKFRLYEGLQLTTRIQIHKASMQFRAWKHMIRMMMPYDSMHGTKAYRPSLQFHAWNHMIPYMEMHGTI